MFRAVNIGIDEINKARKEQPDTGNQDLSELIIARLVEEFDELSPEGLENILTQLAHKIFGRWEDPNEEPIAPAITW